MESPPSAGVSLGDLPAAAIAAAPSPSSPIPSLHHAPASPASAKLVAIADAPPSSTGDLGGAMREAVGPRSSSEIAPDDTAPGGSARQLKPSPGAVLGAINSVLPAARACLGPDDAVRSATVIFKSDGTVSRVDLGGSAHASDDCIRGALSKARTQPFVDDTYAARTTVRP